MKKITAFTKYEDGGFCEIAYNYKEVDEKGTIIHDNAKGSLIVMDDDIKAHIDVIEKYLLSRVGD